MKKRAQLLRSDYTLKQGHCKAKEGQQWGKSEGG